MKINYKKFKCPKCGKSHFIIKDNVEIVPLIFSTKPESIYKNGKLQNPTGLESINKSCKCLECNCNFSVDILGKKYEIVDEDKLQEEREKVFVDYQKRCEDKIKTNLNDCLVQLIPADDLTKSTVEFHDFTYKNNFDEVLKRLDILEEKINLLENKINE